MSKGNKQHSFSPEERDTIYRVIYASPDDSSIAVMIAPGKGTSEGAAAFVNHPG